MNSISMDGQGIRCTTHGHPSSRSLACYLSIAIDKGFIKDVNQKVYSFFPEYAPFAHDGALKRRT